MHKIFFDFSVNLCHTGVHKEKFLIQLFGTCMVRFIESRFFCLDHLNFGDSNLFRISFFELRISGLSGLGFGQQSVKICSFFICPLMETATQAVDTAQQLMRLASDDGNRINQLKRISASRCTAAGMKFRFQKSEARSQNKMK